MEKHYLEFMKRKRDKAVLLFGFCTVFLFASSQVRIKKYVRENTFQLATINPGDTNYSDLKVIGEAMGDARIVMMGEQDHGDAPGYFAKVRIIRYLHEKKGFDVVAFESDFININNDWQQVREGRLELENFIRKDIPPSWSACQTPSPFFYGYLPSVLRSDKPIDITGFDSYTAIPRTIPLLDSVIRDLKLPVTRSPQYGTEILPLLQTAYKYTNDTVTTDKITGYYKQIRREMLTTLPETNFWVLAVDNLIEETSEFRNWKKNVWQNFNDRNIRDRQMALNLKWLCEIKYPTKKIIVWAHNYHVSRYAGHYRKAFLNNAKTMGSVFTEDSTQSATTYVIGFTSYQGTAGRTGEKVYKVEKPKPESFENWISKDYQFAFVDFKKYNLQDASGNDSFFMKCSITGPFHRSEEAQWNRIFDGVFYSKDTYSCEQ